MAKPQKGVLMNSFKNLVCLIAVLVTFVLVGCEHGDDNPPPAETNITNNVTSNTYVIPPPPIQQNSNGGDGNDSSTTTVIVAHSFIVTNGSSHNVPTSFNGGPAKTFAVGETKDDWVTPENPFDFTYFSAGLPIANPLPGGKGYVVTITDSLSTTNGVDAAIVSF